MTHCVKCENSRDHKTDQKEFLQRPEFPDRGETLSDAVQRRVDRAVARSEIFRKAGAVIKCAALKYALIDGGIMIVDQFHIAGLIDDTELTSGVNEQISAPHRQFDGRPHRPVRIHIHGNPLRIHMILHRHVLQINAVFQLIIKRGVPFILLIADHPSVSDADDAVGIEFRDILFVSDQQHQTISGQFLDQIHDFKRIAAVQISGGLVGDNNLRILDDGPGDGYSLALSAGQRARIFVSLRIDPYGFQAVMHPFPDDLSVPDPHHPQSHGDVVENCLVIHQIEILEDISDVRIADCVDPAGTAAGNPLSVNKDAPAVYPVQPADGVEQRGLAAARSAQKGDDAALRQFQTGVVDHMDLIRLMAVEIFVYLL